MNTTEIKAKNDPITNAFYAHRAEVANLLDIRARITELDIQITGMENTTRVGVDHQSQDRNDKIRRLRKQRSALIAQTPEGQDRAAFYKRQADEKANVKLNAAKPRLRELAYEVESLMNALDRLDILETGAVRIGLSKQKAALLELAGVE